ncbi:MAG: acyltransferase [Clostridia bacterium]|nr:acyltransferase [Clostridia bacterium]
MSSDAARPQKWDIGVLHGFRAIMVLLVANFHIWQQGWLMQTFHIGPVTLELDFLTRSSYIFVDGMILLSAFLLFLPYARSMEENCPLPDPADFYLNRLFRIVPSYLVAVLLALFCIALPQRMYYDQQTMHLDLWSHLTFTHTFFRQSYQYTNLNGVLWTVAIEMQMYLLFPLIGRMAKKQPAWTLIVMTALGWGYRAVVYYRVQDTAMLINQLPAFLDVYAIGMLGAIVYCRLRRLLGDPDGKQSPLIRMAGLLMFAAGVLLVLSMARMQSTAGISGAEGLRLGQLRHRLPLTLSLMVCMLGAMFMPGAFRWLLSNRLMRFLAGISYNFYIWHQVLSVQMRLHWMPEGFPQTAERPIQWAFTVLCYAVAILVAMAFTYGWEQPCAKWLRKGVQYLKNRKHPHPDRKECCK